MNITPGFEALHIQVPKEMGNAIRDKAARLKVPASLLLRHYLAVALGLPLDQVALNKNQEVMIERIKK